MTAFLAILVRDLKLAQRAGGDILSLLMFFVMFGAIIPIAIGPDKELLSRIAPGVAWLAAFLSTLLGVDRLFKADHEDGSMRGFRHASISLEGIVFAKMLAHWLTTIVPLILTLPLLAIMLNMSSEAFWRTALSLLVGAPGLLSLGTIGAALTVSIKRGGLIAPVLILPLSIPILIFGVSAITTDAGPSAQFAALLLLSGLSLILTALSPFVAALALKLAAD